MGKKIKGKDFVLYIEKDGQNTPVCCGLDLTINLNQEAIEATKAPNSRWRNYIGGYLDFSLATSTLVTIGEGVDITDLYEYMSQGRVLEFVAMANTQKEVFFSGKVLITNLSVTGGTNDITTYTLSATGDGELNIVNPYSIVLLTDEDGNVIEDGEGNPIYTQEHGDLNPIDLEINC